MIRLAFLLVPFLFSVSAAAFPILRIDTGGAEITKKQEARGTLSIDPNGADPAWSLTAPMKIKIRGNSTATFPKKPYKVKLDVASTVFGMPADREWVLLANYVDKTLMRNIVANEMSRRIGLPYTPREQIVEVVVNGKERGTYVFTEQLKVSKDRVPATMTDVTGGYLIEMDRHRDERFQIVTRDFEPYAVRFPEKPTLSQLYYLQTYLQKAEDVLLSKDFADPLRGYSKYIDVDSFIDWYLLNEIAKSPDAGNYSSIFFYKASGEKLKMGPVWDFDIALGNTAWVEANPADGWWVRKRSPWFKRLFRDPAFEARVKERWKRLKSRRVDPASMNEFIDRTAASLELSQRKNFEIWPIMNQQIFVNPIPKGSYGAEVAFLKQWLTARMEWLESQYGSATVPGNGR